MCSECERLYILYADGEISLEVVEVLRQLIAVVIVGEQALEEGQQLQEQKQGEGEGGGGRKRHGHRGRTEAAWGGWIPKGGREKRAKYEKQILQAPQSQTSSSLGPPAPWRRTPAKPHRSAAVRCPPGCPPTTGEEYKTSHVLIVKYQSVQWWRCSSHIVPPVDETPSSWQTDSGACPTLHNTSPSLCRISSWLPAADKRKTLSDNNQVSSDFSSNKEIACVSGN